MMRDSGVEFLGEIPSHWAVQPAVTLARVLTSTIDKKSYDGEQPVRLCNYTDVYYRDEIVDSAEFMVATASSEQVAKFSVRAGDVPFTKDSETAADIGIPSYVPHDLPGTVYGYHLSIFRPIDKQRGRFLKYLLESNYAKTYFESKTPGVTRVGLAQSTIRYFRVPTPPLKEAVALADFLDRETAKIDAFIAKNEELITLLTEKLTVTRADLATGADLSGTRRTTELFWAPTVPENWEVVPLTSVARLETGHTPSKTVPEFWREEECVIPWISLNDVGDLTKSEFTHVTTNRISPAGLAGSSARVLPKGTVVLSRDATIGRSSIMAAPMATSQHFANWVCGDRILPRYLWLLFTSCMQDLFESMTNGSTIRTIGIPDLRSFRVPLPSLTEQERIVRAVAARSEKVRMAIDTAARARRLAIKRRAALISAAVTGEIALGVAE